MNIRSQFIDYLQSPLGLLEIQASIQHLEAIKFVSDYSLPTNPNVVTSKTKEQLTEYFAGSRQRFTLPLGAKGTQFQQQVWQQLLKIPYGTTCSYSHIAQAMQNPKAVRAVGAANGRNPLTIVVPCHRVIGADGSLTGYAWGTSIKAALLQHEQTHKYPKS
ncbi:methylated-DNA--[protein]-cysteine S-methyltransferase [Paraglaciecola hydrolytica]|uniref:Methylated-DNA--protein-cysteine methyltransferase n=1 Tax=Paraglaciecola hydrolytica TaxID=1799789 RepID=A0A136A321_9ALTE|nr:methylated-DNA--[protein]-cysteine S-methyltransferase [Paraglaciecola hydrolytica]KXI29649.1 cysteine methyltransferase [Paraglaciecola hydrolytica]